MLRCCSIPFSWLLLGVLLWSMPVEAGPPGQKLRRTSLPAVGSIALPAEFTVMPDEAIAAKYPGPRKPLAAYSSANGKVDFIATEKNTPFKPGDLAILLRFYKANISNAYGNRVEYLQEQVVKINGREFIAFEFNSILSDGTGTGKGAPLRRYTYMLYTVLPATSATDTPRLLSLTFTCPSVLTADWQPIGRKVLATVKLK
ncbi:MAG: hypothetical protein H7330_15390 [Hymenobacteraceae bacterium]|nr:hypothetical protein [Hymenobacteraceae bacterium]